MMRGAGLVGATVLLAIAGCAHFQPAPVDHLLDPGWVAMAYENAIMAGDYATARQYVLADDRAVVDALQISAPSAQPASGTIAVGEVRDDGRRATVSWVGKICRAGASSKEDCIENSEPGTTSALFLVRLLRQDNQEWLVTIRNR